MLVAACSWAWGDLGARLHAAFTVPEAPAGSGFRIDAWISPPPYTRKEPFVLPDAASKGNEPIAVPAGSQLTVKINGPDAAGYNVALQEGRQHANPGAREPVKRDLRGIRPEDREVSDADRSSELRRQPHLGVERRSGPASEDFVHRPG